MQDISIISKSAITDIAKQIEKTLEDKYGAYSYGDIEWYISRWQETYYDWKEITGYNFEIIIIDGTDSIHTMKTLQQMSNELLLKIAVDLGIEIPGLMYSVAEIKGILNDRYKDIGKQFEDACKEVYSAPDRAISEITTALESLLAEICKDESIENCDPKAGIYELTKHVLEQLGFLPDKKLNDRIRSLGTGLLKSVQIIGEIRNKHTKVHRKSDEIITESFYAVFVVNSVATIGLFLLNYYEKHYKPNNPPSQSLEDDEIPF